MEVAAVPQAGPVAVTTLADILASLTLRPSFPAPYAIMSKVEWLFGFILVVGNYTRFDVQTNVMNHGVVVPSL